MSLIATHVAPADECTDLLATALPHLTFEGVGERRMPPHAPTLLEVASKLETRRESRLPQGDFLQYIPETWWRNRHGEWVDEAPNATVQVGHVSRQRGRSFRREDEVRNVFRFFSSTATYDWLCFWLAFPLLVCLHYFLAFAHPGAPMFFCWHLCGLLVWVGVAALFLLVLTFHMGNEIAVDWVTGYILEFLFSLENVAVFNVVVKHFRTPAHSLRKAISAVIFAQMLFQMFFYMGLADRLRAWRALPYLLGGWLIYVGLGAMAGEQDHSSVVRVEDTSAYKVMRNFIGDSLSPVYTSDSSISFKDDFGERRVSLLAPVIVCLVMVDFMLEIDVTLTKIEVLNNEFLAFSSSALAAFAVPELFFVSQVVMRRYCLVQYGIAFVLVLFGVQMLLHKIIQIPELWFCSLIMIVLFTCMILSELLYPTSDMEDDPPIGGKGGDAAALS